MHNIKQSKRIGLLIILGCILVLAGCNTTTPPQDLPPVETGRASFEIEPKKPKAGEPAIATATITGFSDLSEVDVEIEFSHFDSIIRDVLETERTDNKYTTEYTFDKPGMHQIIVHIYAPTIHQRYSAEVEVVE